MIITTWNDNRCRALTLLMFTALFYGMGLQVGTTQEDDMQRDNFQISIDAQRLTFIAQPILKDDIWLVPLEGFAEHLGLKVEYPEGEKMVVLCGGTESELCVPLQFQDGKDGVVAIDGVAYARPARVAEPFGFNIYEASPDRLEVIQSSHLAPEFTLPDLQGTPRRLRDFRGKKTFLYVWGSW